MSADGQRVEGASVRLLRTFEKAPGCTADYSTARDWVKTRVEQAGLDAVRRADAEMAAEAADERRAAEGAAAAGAAKEDAAAAGATDEQRAAAENAAARVAGKRHAAQ